MLVVHHPGAETGLQPPSLRPAQTVADPDGLTQTRWWVSPHSVAWGHVRFLRLRLAGQRLALLSTPQCEQLDLATATQRNIHTSVHTLSTARNLNTNHGPASTPASMIHPAWFRTHRLRTGMSNLVLCRIPGRPCVWSAQRPALFLLRLRQCYLSPTACFPTCKKYPGYIIIVTCAHDIMRMTDTDTDTNTDTSRADRVE